MLADDAGYLVNLESHFAPVNLDRSHCFVYQRRLYGQDSFCYLPTFLTTDGHSFTQISSYLFTTHK